MQDRTKGNGKVGAAVPAKLKGGAAGPKSPVDAKKYKLYTNGDFSDVLLPADVKKYGSVGSWTPRA